MGGRLHRRQGRARRHDAALGRRVALRARLDGPVALRRAAAARTGRRARGGAPRAHGRLRRRPLPVALPPRPRAHERHQHGAPDRAQPRLHAAPLAAHRRAARSALPGRRAYRRRRPDGRVRLPRAGADGRPVDDAARRAVPPRTGGGRLGGPRRRLLDDAGVALLRVGLAVSLTGPLAPMGSCARRGLELWADEARAARRAVELVVRDDRSAARTAREQVEDLLRRVDLLAGPYSSGLTRAVAPIAEAHGVVLWNHGGAANGFVGPSQWQAGADVVPDLGSSAAHFVRRFTACFGVAPDYAAAQAYAAGVVMSRCVELAGTLDQERLRAAAATLDCTTLFGRFRIDPVTGLQTGHEMLLVEWVEGRRRVVPV